MTPFPIARGRRAAAALAAGFLLGTFVWPDDRPPPPRPAVVALLAEPVALVAGRPEQRRLGDLVFLEGWRLSSRDVRFGGISAIHVADGEVLALSDAGHRFRFRVPSRAGEAPVRIERIAQGPGRLRRKSDRDAEAVAVHGANVWIAYESYNEVWRYRREGFAAETAAAPPAMRGWRYTRGSEAMVRLPDGRFLIFAEGPRAGDGTTPLLLFAGDPAHAATPVQPLRYRPPDGFRPTDAALLPDGRLVVLNRDFSLTGGWKAVLAIAEAPGRQAVIEGRELARLSGSVTRDNMEALSVGREGGRTILWLASDDNLNPLLQRTLLLKFALAE